MSGSSTPLRFHFDFISHNAYLAWTQVHALAARYGRAVEPVPVLFAALLGAYGQLGPAEVIPKALWMARNVLRKAVRLGVPLLPPASHPFNPLLALRIASLPLDAVTQRRVIDALFRATWSEGLDVTRPEVVAERLTRDGLGGAALVAAAGESEAKTRLRAATDAALAAGVFGVPTVIVDGELFFGFDDFGHLELFLRGEDPLDRSAFESWLGIRASSRRDQDPRAKR